MQVPEKLALIGGSILLASTLIFTLKSQASHIIPSVGHSISNIYDHVDDTQDDLEFGNGYRQAKQKHWRTGMWGSAKYYIDDRNNMYISKGKLQGHIYDVLDKQELNSLRTINLTQTIVFPTDSSALLAMMPQLTSINGLEKADITNIRNLCWTFSNDPSLHSLDLGSWNTSKDTGYGDTFHGDKSLSYIDISKFHDAWNMGGEFNETNIKQMKVGPDTDLWWGQGVQGHNKWQAPDGFIGDYPGKEHPGLWHVINP